MSTPPTRTWPQRVERRLVDRLSARALKRLGEGEAAPRPTTWGTVAGLALALPVHLVSLAAVVGGVWLLLASETWMPRLGGIFLLLVALAVRPSAGGLPDHVAEVDRTSAPHLFALVDRVAEANGAPSVHRILVDAEFNASASHAGWRRHRVLTMGAQLWAASTPQERVAHIGHELGHFAHGDLLHGWWVGAAQETLSNWLESLGGESSAVVDDEVRENERLLLAPLRVPVLAYLVALTYANAPSHQRQEYLADLDSARAAGTQAAISSLDVLLAEPAVTAAVTRGALTGRTTDLWQDVADAVAAAPRSTVLSRRRVATEAAVRIDDSHPATHLRIALLETRPELPASVVLDTATVARIDAELAPALAVAARAAAAEAVHPR